MADQSSRRLAFVLGNGAYLKAQSLATPVNDVRAVAAKLARLGFRVRGGITGADATRTGRDAPPPPAENLGRSAIIERFAAFVAELAPGDVAVMYYAGHGLQVGDFNYLVPVDAGLDGSMPLRQLVSIRDLIDQARRKIGSAGKVIVALDACREDPFPRDAIERLEESAKEGNVQSQTGTQTFALVHSGFATFSLRVEQGMAPTYIMFATAPGELADDASVIPSHAGHSPFAAAFLDHVATRGLTLNGLTERIIKDVRAATTRQRIASGSSRHAQEPWHESNLSEDFHFRPTEWRPVFELAGLGWLAGLVTCWAAFDKSGQLLHVTQHAAAYLLGVIFAVTVVGFGVMRWGSRRWGHAALAATVSAAAFVPALWVMDQANPPKLTEYKHWNIRLTALMENPELVAVVFLALLGGIILSLGTILGCKPQRSNFRGFSAPAAGVAVGLGVGVGYIVFASLSYLCRGMGIDKELMILCGSGWYAVFGGALGYCFRYFVVEHTPLEARAGWAPPPEVHRASASAAERIAG